MSEPEKRTKKVAAEPVTSKPRSVAAEAPEVVAVEGSEQPKRWNVGGVFWGLLFVLIGALLLLANLDILDVNLSNIWQLWPVLIIGAGVSMLSLRGWVAALVAAVLGLGVLVLVAATVVDNPYFKLPTAQTSTYTQTIVEEENSTVERLDVTVKTGAAEVVVSSSERREDVVATLESSHMTLNNMSTVEGATRFVTFTTDSTKQFWTGNIKNTLDLDFTQALPLSLRLDIGASSLRGDLSKTKLSTLSVKAGASTINVKLGAGTPKQDITLEAGASTVTLDIPRDSGVRVFTEGGLNSTDFEGIDRVSDGKYETKDFDTATSQITIRAELGASTFNIDRY